MYLSYRLGSRIGKSKIICGDSFYNQQKVVLRRELAQAPALIIAMQPTRGLDVGATPAVQSRILTERDRGAGILHISTELEEAIALLALVGKLGKSTPPKANGTPYFAENRHLD